MFLPGDPFENLGLRRRGWGRGAPLVVVSLIVIGTGVAGVLGVTAAGAASLACGCTLLPSAVLHAFFGECDDDEGEDDDGGGPPKLPDDPLPSLPGTDWDAFDRARGEWDAQRVRPPVGAA